jgi:hypothetical protein
MGESEGRKLTTSWSPKPKTSAQHKADLDAKKRQKQALDELSLRISSEDREIWPGKAHELAKKVADELGADETQPGKLAAALEQACQRYIQKNGRPFKPKSLRESLRGWRYRQDGLKY